MDIELLPNEQLITWLRTLKPQLGAVLDGLPSVLSRDDIDKRVFSHETRGLLGLPPTLSTNKLIDLLVKEGDLQIAKFAFPSRNIYRYLRGTPSLYQVVQTLKPGAYFSHYTAVSLHGLTEQVPKAVYLNWEQRLSAGGGTLSQGGIDRAFKGKCRLSNNVAEYKDHLVYLLNGANTGGLGAIDLAISDGSILRVTGIERTLIDATVRPVYAGGVFQVAQAFVLARGQVSVPALVKMLEELHFTYPYHQVIGYFLQRAGYDDNDLDLLRSFPMQYDFYLDYGMKRTEYIPEWKLFVPKGF